eukprot:CAMPEP_0194154150 /NCGR_PEP_ID=MMETSP0152-20130528/59404_1 /TAXON_ID=1049557 /ORGANISM="Thalassiothrix antarctica, Strain L6-D1" /LENGTH=169 /DNA_ID=CAMNT_0038859999 /DNA_START=9 /DNA_END=514 /DNA_ORIENTATION=-
MVCVASMPQTGPQTAVEHYLIKKTKGTFESEVSPGLAQFAELPNAAMQAIKGEAIAGDLFSQAGVYSNMTPENTRKQNQPTTIMPITFNPGMAKSLVPRTTVLQRSSNGNAVMPLVSTMNAVSKIIAKTGKKLLKSDVVDETIEFIDDIRWALGNDNFSCNHDNSSTDS